MQCIHLVAQVWALSLFSHTGRRKTSTEQEGHTISPSDAASMCVTGAMRAEKQPESRDLVPSYVAKNAAARTKHRHSLFTNSVSSQRTVKQNSSGFMQQCELGVNRDRYRLEKIPPRHRARRRRRPGIPRPCGSPADSVNVS